MDSLPCVPTGMALDAFTDRAVTLQLPNAQGVQGMAAGVDDTGAFLLRGTHAALAAYNGGEISLRLDTPQK